MTILFLDSKSKYMMSSTPTRLLQPHKPRRTHRKTRTGCLVCRRRKVKCDERRPVCGNCVKRGLEHECQYKGTIGSVQESCSSKGSPESLVDMPATAPPGESMTVDVYVPSGMPESPNLHERALEGAIQKEQLSAIREAAQEYQDMLNSHFTKPAPFGMQASIIREPSQATNQEEYPFGVSAPFATSSSTVPTVPSGYIEYDNYTTQPGSMQRHRLAHASYNQQKRHVQLPLPTSMLASNPLAINLQHHTIIPPIVRTCSDIATATPPSFSHEEQLSSLSLFYHFLSETYLTFNTRPEVRLVWKDLIPRLALLPQHPYLLHAVLSSAALHAAFTNPTNFPLPLGSREQARKKLLLKASMHHQQTLVHFQEALAAYPEKMKTSPETVEAIIATSSLLVVHGFASGAGVLDMPIKEDVKRDEAQFGLRCATYGGSLVGNNTVDEMVAADGEIGGREGEVRNSNVFQEMLAETVRVADTASRANATTPEIPSDIPSAARPLTCSSCSPSIQSSTASTPALSSQSPPIQSSVSHSVPLIRGVLSIIGYGGSWTTMDSTRLRPLGSVYNDRVPNHPYTTQLAELDALAENDDEKDWFNSAVAQLKVAYERFFSFSDPVAVVGGYLGTVEEGYIARLLAITGRRHADEASTAMEHDAECGSAWSAKATSPENLRTLVILAYYLVLPRICEDLAPAEIEITKERHEQQETAEPARSPSPTTSPPNKRPRTKFWWFEGLATREITEIERYFQDLDAKGAEFVLNGHRRPWCSLIQWPIKMIRSPEALVAPLNVHKT
ncbi:hypothetical protein BDZ91DRAFT_330971 [Kalaharituber pfeilii]|nr:hypothetical protein BDZ91DRAFT_330971 [Kalaharituber pfeilii]